MPDELNFDDLSPIEIPVKILGKQYVLREASGDAATRYRNALLKATRMTDGKVSAVEGIADAEPLIVSLCLFEVQTSKDGQQSISRSPVPTQTVRSWPNRIQRRLFEKIRQISELEEQENEETLQTRLTDTQTKLAALKNGHAQQEEKEKNSSEPTETGSYSPVA